MMELRYTLFCNFRPLFMLGFQKWVARVAMLPWDFFGQLWDFEFSSVHARSAPCSAPKKLNLNTFLETEFKFLEGLRL